MTDEGLDEYENVAETEGRLTRLSALNLIAEVRRLKAELEDTKEDLADATQLIEPYTEFLHAKADATWNEAVEACAKEFSNWFGKGFVIFGYNDIQKMILALKKPEVKP